MTRSGYASSIRSTLSGLSVKKGCCQHAFQDGVSLFRNEMSSADNAELLLSYTRKVKCPNCIPNFVRGIFCSCGTVTDPEKSHHLEFSFHSEKERDALADLLSAQSFLGKKNERKGKYLLYWKDSEIIADFLAFLGAKTVAFDYMNSCIEKDIRNGINREVNCDTANIGKTVTASERQTFLIHQLIDHHMLETLPEPIRITAILRLENDSLSLAQLGELHSPPISKSCVNHRLARLCEAAERFLSSTDSSKQ